MIIWRDGEWLEDGDVLPADDRGLTLGDGVFETLLAMDGALAHAALHFHVGPCATTSHRVVGVALQSR